MPNPQNLKSFSNQSVLLLFAILGFLIYGNTLNNDFALDDTIVITSNQYTKKGISGIPDHLTNDHFTGFYGQEKNLVSGGRYRPLSLIFFSMQYELFGEKAWIGHFCNILFYIINGFLIFLVIKQILYPLNEYSSTALPLLASLLWFLHPVHTEAVANIKGLDEILSFCFALLALHFSLKYLDKGKRSLLIWTSMSFLLSLLAKESAITWLAVIPLATYFFRKLSRKAVHVFLSLLVAAIFWFLLRQNAIGSKSIFENVADNLMNDPFLFASSSEKFATIMYTMGKYLQLLIFPHPLTFDYYPKHIPIVGWSNPFVVLSSLILLGLAIFAVKKFKKKSLISFSILFYAITLSVASNILFPVGVFMNERFIYVSSLGFCIVTAWLIDRQMRKEESRKLMKTLTLLVFILYAGKTFSRNFDWKNNYTLSTTDAKTSVNGAKSNLMAGGTSLERAMEENKPLQKQKLLNDAVYYLNRALLIYPQYVDALLLMGNAQWTATSDASKAMQYYRKILQINPQHADAWRNIHIVLGSGNKVDQNIRVYEDLIKFYPGHPDNYIQLGRLYGQQKNDLASAINVLERGRAVSAGNFELLSNLGTAYGMAGNFEKAVEVLQQAVQLRPNHSKTHADLGLSYYFLGEHERAKEQFDKAVELDPQLVRSNFPI